VDGDTIRQYTINTSGRDGSLIMAEFDASENNSIESNSVENNSVENNAGSEDADIDVNDTSASSKDVEKETLNWLLQKYPHREAGQQYWYKTDYNTNSAVQLNFYENYDVEYAVFNDYHIKSAVNVQAKKSKFTLNGDKITIDCMTYTVHRQSLSDMRIRMRLDGDGILSGWYDLQVIL
jgi:hypothetical protein